MMGAPTAREARVACEAVESVSRPAMATRMKARCSSVPSAHASSSARGDSAMGV